MPDPNPSQPGPQPGTCPIYEGQVPLWAYSVTKAALEANGFEFKSPQGYQPAEVPLSVEDTTQDAESGSGYTLSAGISPEQSSTHGLFDGLRQSIDDYIARHPELERFVNSTLSTLSRNRVKAGLALSTLGTLVLVNLSYVHNTVEAHAAAPEEGRHTIEYEADTVSLDCLLQGEGPELPETCPEGYQSSGLKSSTHDELVCENKKNANLCLTDAGIQVVRSLLEEGGPYSIEYIKDNLIPPGRVVSLCSDPGTDVNALPQLICDKRTQCYGNEDGKYLAVGNGRCYPVDIAFEHNGQRVTYGRDATGNCLLNQEPTTTPISTPIPLSTAAVPSLIPSQTPDSTVVPATLTPTPSGVGEGVGEYDYEKTEGISPIPGLLIGTASVVVFSILYLAAKKIDLLNRFKYNYQLGLGDLPVEDILPRWLWPF
ncbi:hypothetical protein JXB41_03555 [Candidatus Woesearchaeota archaeon]|nr:hypothetical protein [Candidatus Woesearchaeota archaeon]